MITRLGSRMDDTVAESKCVAPREVLTPLLNLSSGDQRFEEANHVALTEAPVISLPDTKMQFTNQAKKHDPFNNFKYRHSKAARRKTKENSLIKCGERQSSLLCGFYFIQAGLSSFLNWPKNICQLTANCPKLASGISMQLKQELKMKLNWLLI